jgi:hypothetical protein
MAAAAPLVYAAVVVAVSGATWWLARRVGRTRPARVLVGIVRSATFIVGVLWVIASAIALGIGWPAW